MDENIQAPQPTIDRSFSTSALDRSTPLGEDSAAMTIEFLRARLLSERSVSKAARQRTEQLAKKVLELEDQLESEIQLRKKLESARLEVLSKYREELIADYGHFFVSNSGEGYSGKITGGPKESSHAAVASRSRSDDIEDLLDYEETFMDPLEEKEGSCTGSMTKYDRQDSSSQLNLDEGPEGSINDDDIELMGREKGILAWDRRRGLKRQQDKERGHSTERFGRTFSQRSFASASADGESPHKRWIGKSVRQTRRKENRVHDANSEEGLGQSQESEDMQHKSGDPEDMKEGLQCAEERDTEVERVLERQAELIEQFQAEENAQRAWEEKFREQNSLINNDGGQDVSVHKSSNEEKNMPHVTAEQSTQEEARQSTQEEARSKDDSTKLVGADEILSSQPIEDDGYDKATSLKGDVLTLSQAVYETVAEDSSRIEGGNNKLALNAMVEASSTSDAVQADMGPLFMRGMAASSEGLVDETEHATSKEANRQNTIGVTSDLPIEIHEQSFQTTDMEAIQENNSRSEETQGLTEVSSRIPKGEVPEKPESTTGMDIQSGQKQMSRTAVRYAEVGKPSFYNKESSHSFKFNAYPASSVQNLNMPTEHVTGSSHQLVDDPHAYAQNQVRNLMEGYNDRPREQVGFFPSHKGNGATDIHSTGLTAERTIENHSRRSGEFEAPIVSDQAHMVGMGFPMGDARSVSHGNFSFGFRPKAAREPIDRGWERTTAPDKPVAFGTTEVSQQAGEDGFGEPNGLEGDVLRDDKAVQVEGTNQRIRSQASWAFENGLTDGNSSHTSSDNLTRDSPWEEVFKQRMRAQEAAREQAGRPKNLHSFPGYPIQQPQYASANREGMSFDNTPYPTSRNVIPEHSAPWGYGFGSHVYQETGFQNHRKSVDSGFDRVMEVLRALQIAKHQVQSSDGPATVLAGLDAAYRSGYDGRDGFYTQPPPPYPGYSTLPPLDMDATTPYPYTHVRGLKPFIPDLGGRAAAAAGATGYARNYPQGAHNKNVYQPQDGRQHR